MKKQFVWIMTDSTRYDMLGCYGNQDMCTPNLDALAKEGVRFDRVYTGQPVCGPARSLLFTGLYPHENGWWGNSMPLGADVKTLGQRLSERNIPCAYIGKWHLDGGDYFGNGICPDGWDKDYWYDMKCYLDELGSDAERFRSRDSGICYENGGINADYTYGHRCADRALKYIDAHGDEDFFLTVSFDEPHDPSLCPEPYASMYREYLWPESDACYDTLEGKPEYQKLWSAQAGGTGRRMKAPLFLGCNAYIDTEIGRIIDHIHATLPDAVILFTSDHGDAMAEHGLYAKGPTVYDGIARVPLIISGPGFMHGEVIKRTVSHADLPATVLDYMGLRVPNAFSGHSLVETLQGEEEDANGCAFVEFNRYERDHDNFGGFQPMRSIVTDKYKLSLYLCDTDELYDIEKDPDNMNNLINDPEYAEIRNELHDRLIQWMNETRDPFRGYQWECRPWRPDKKPSWMVDGWTRQYKNDPGEYRQLDYSTGLTIKKTSRPK